MRSGRRLLAASVLTLLAACGPPARPTLPSGTGTPFPGFASAYEQAIDDCKSTNTISAEIALSGRAAGNKLRGRINAGFAAPEDIVLEGLAPFGRPAFVLFGRGGDATLWLPRDERVLRGAPPASIVEALAGIALTPAELRAVTAGCGVGVTSPSSGRMLNDNWAVVDGKLAAAGAQLPAVPEPERRKLEAASSIYLRRIEGRWRLAAVVRDGLTIQYADFSAGRARTVYVRTPAADLTLQLSQVEINGTIDPRAFAVEVPADALPLSLAELRRAGPLGERR